MSDDIPKFIKTWEEAFSYLSIAASRSERTYKAEQALSIATEALELNAKRYPLDTHSQSAVFALTKIKEIMNDNKDLS